MYDENEMEVMMDDDKQDQDICIVYPSQQRATGQGKIVWEKEVDKTEEHEDFCLCTNLINMLLDKVK